MSSWKVWKELEGGGRTFDAPSATGSVDAFVRGTDNRVFQNHFLSGTRWDKWNPVDGMTTPSAPATTVLSGALYVFVRGMDDLIHFNRFVGNWEGWKPVPGGERTQDAPGVAAGVLPCGEQMVPSDSTRSTALLPGGDGTTYLMGGEHPPRQLLPISARASFCSCGE